MLWIIKGNIGSKNYLAYKQSDFIQFVLKL